MRVRLSALESSGPQVIPLIPNMRLCHLEGRNGIGKTLAARLLEIATGEQPFASIPAAWRTLCDQLGPVEIIVDELAGEQDTLTVRFLLEPSEWPHEPEQLTDAKRGRVWRAGKEISFGEVRGFLRVTRIGGEETLRQTVVNQLTLRQNRGQRLISAVTTRRDIWDNTLDEIEQLTGDVTLVRIEAESAAAAHAQVVADDVDQQQELHEAIASTAADTKATLVAMSALAKSLPELTAQLEDGKRRVDDLNKKLKEADGELLAASAAVAAGQQAQETLHHAETLRSGRFSRLRSCQLTEQFQLRQLGLKARPSQAERRTLLLNATAEREAVRSRLSELDTTGMLLDLTGLIETPLARSASQLGSQIVSATPPLSVQELLEGVRERRDQLKTQPRPGEVERLRTEEGAITKRIDQLNALGWFIDDTNRKEKLLRDSDDEIAKLLTKASGGLLDSYRAAQKKQSDLRFAVVTEEVTIKELRLTLESLLEKAGVAVSSGEQLATLETALIDSLADVSQRITSCPDNGLGTKRAVLTKLGSLEANPPIPDEFWLSLLDTVEKWANETNIALVSARARTQDAQRELAAAGSQLAATRVRLRQTIATLRGPTWQPLRQTLDMLASRMDYQKFETLALQLPARHLPAMVGDPTPSRAEKAAAQICEDLQKASEKLANAADAVARAADTSYTYLDRLVRSLQPLSGAAILPAGRELPGEHALTRWLEREFTELFDATDLRRELFNNASSVQFQMNDYTLRWQGEDGQWRRRPLEAFSSGEQAFAYTRAKLASIKAQIGTNATRHVLVILDEFGAFVARDRLSHLLTFVEQEALDEFAEQAVVMLPLSRELPEAVVEPSGIGPDPSDPEDKQVAAWGYFCRDVVSVAR